MKTARPGTKTDTLLAAIDSVPADKFGNPVAIRATALAKVTGIDRDSISGLLAPHVKTGRLVICKITVPESVAQSEYRKGPGVPPTEFKPLDTRRAGVALHIPASRGNIIKAPALSTPRPTADTIETPTLLKPQPAVGKNTDSARSDSSLILPEARAVAAKATPKPKAGARLKEEPATPEASAGDATYLGALDISINHEGTLIIGTVESVIELAPEHTRRLGNFMLGSQGVWNPF